ncbi:helix-turn-helix domain-containing protein [Pirellula sp. SH-Sr6A]|uniref:helix-turn-helix domain-containing protein n=1 Tax=Pirellula sp. SH-Sr6A TaxID=1632865 RepID=UPI0011BACE43|nr:helix-turn-helix transcriptional regulator [Pirellula sp. SH-Sr6A]
MDTSEKKESWYDPREGGEAIRLCTVCLDGPGTEPPRTNCFGLYFIEAGSGVFSVDDACHPFHSPSLLCVVPYQYVRFQCEDSICCRRIEFHANFLCIETFHAEVGCAGRVFNDPYGVPVIGLDVEIAAEMADLFASIAREQSERRLAYMEASLAYLKLLLILATRTKDRIDDSCAGLAASHRHPTLASLSVLIEERYRTWHSPAEYADALCVTPKTLGRLVREHLGTTPTDLIRRRIMTHAKWQLLHTLKPVKEIALEIGFGDELYFSRVFKKATGVAPSFFREFETTIRGGSNLSMPLD